MFESLFKRCWQRQIGNIPRILSSLRPCVVGGLSLSLPLFLSCVARAQPPAPTAQSAAPRAESTAEPPITSPRLIVVQGAGGTQEYHKAFRQQASQWLALTQQSNMQLVHIHEGDSSAGQSHRDALRDAIAEATTAKAPQLWLILIGHGTSERGTHKFNLVGTDVSSRELSDWLKPFEQVAIVINCSSASAPFLPELSGHNRIVVTATRSGSENNYSRFGGQLANCILDPATDIDHDDEVSLLEAFLAASTKTEMVYREQNRLATEHALLDDNGDKLGTGAEFFRGTRAVKTAKNAKQPDGAVAAKVILHALPAAVALSAEAQARRAEIETQIEQLRSRKPTPATQEYWSELEQLLLSLAQLYPE